jgi:threonine aldolase
VQFGSDNQTGASPKVLEKLLEANRGYTHGYGDDAWTKAAVTKLEEVFECDLDAFFVMTGTAANVLALSCMVQPWEMVLCHARAHLLTDESTAPEFFTGGARLVGLGHGTGKLTADHLRDYLASAETDVPHSPQARVVSLTQANENGLVYTANEIASVSDVAKEFNLLFHMDGARFANALVSSRHTPAELTWKVGVDALCLGATKNGALLAEAVIFFHGTYASSMMHRRKRSGHLVSKGRVLGAQMLAWLEDDHWQALARHSNALATQLSETLTKVTNVKIVWPTQSNEVFAVMPKTTARRLRMHGAEFYEWSSAALPTGVALQDDQVLVRLVTSFMTTREDVQAFIEVACNADVKQH